jgi:REP element-mobilizing transposase RayT
MAYQYGSHTILNIGHHFLWVIKYRYYVLQDYK